MSNTLFDRRQAVPAPVKHVEPKAAPVAKRERKPLPKVWNVECYRTSFPSMESKLLVQRAFARRGNAARYLAALCERNQGGKDFAIEFIFENISKAAKAVR